MAMKEYSTFTKAPGRTGVSPSGCLVSYLGHSLRVSYLYAEMQSVYSTIQADWACLVRPGCLRDRR